MPAAGRARAGDAAGGGVATRLPRSGPESGPSDSRRGPCLPAGVTATRHGRRRAGRATAACPPVPGPSRNQDGQRRSSRLTGPCRFRPTRSVKFHNIDYANSRMLSAATRLRPDRRRPAGTFRGSKRVVRRRMGANSTCGATQYRWRRSGKYVSVVSRCGLWVPSRVVTSSRRGTEPRRCCVPAARLQTDRHMPRRVCFGRVSVKTTPCHGCTLRARRHGSLRV